MTELKQAAQAVLDAWDSPLWKTGTTASAIADLRTVLEQQQAEPVSHAAIAGALFDFMGWLTTRKERLVLSSVDNASPAADAIKVFAEMRGLSLNDARVQDWQNYTTPPQQQAEPVAMVDDEGVIIVCSYKYKPGDKLYTSPPQRQWVGLTDEEVKFIWKNVIGWGDQSHDDEDLVRAIEAKLKERNHDR